MRDLTVRSGNEEAIRRALTRLLQWEAELTPCSKVSLTKGRLSAGYSRHNRGG